MTQSVSSGPSRSVLLATIAVFAALIAVGTILSIPLPAPLYEITWAPAVYMALSSMADPATSAMAIGIGSFIGEAFNVSFKGGGSPIYPFGMLWARVPEAFIIGWARQRNQRTLIMAMAAATVFETFAFLLSDWLFYAYGLFQYGAPTTAIKAFVAASTDFGTLADLAYIPVSLVLIRAARPSFKRLGFG
jgi:uncharacterized membrane protein